MIETVRFKDRVGAPPRLVSESGNGHRLMRRADTMVPMMGNRSNSKKVPENMALLGPP